MKCRVCGRPYEACRSLDRSAGVFRWQSVACSPECGAEYLRLIEAARGVPQDRAAEPDAAVAADAPAITAPAQKRGKSKASTGKEETPKKAQPAHQEEHSVIEK